MRSERTTTASNSAGEASQRGVAGVFAMTMMLALCAVSSGCRWNSTGQNTMGVRLYQQGRYAEALQQFQVAQSSDPSNPDAYYNLASTYHKLGVGKKDARLIEQSESLYNQCLDLSPNHVDCHRGLAVLLVESNRRDSAVRLLNNWAAKNPQLSDPLVELARINQELGKTDLAERYLGDALAINASDARAWSAKAQLHEASGNLGEAAQDYQRSLSINNYQPGVAQKVASLNYRIAQSALGRQNSQWTAQNPQPGGQQRY